jgi:hypothetical protein
MMAAGDGLISMAPTSIAYSGTSAAINADGGVDFSAVTSLSLNGVFTSDYDNYLIVVSHVSTNSEDCSFRLRASGSDASGSNYTYQYLLGNGGTVQGGRTSSTSSWRAVNTAVNANGSHIHLYGPALAQPTAYREVAARGVSAAFIDDNAGTHSLSTAYDGFTIFLASLSITGNIHVFGYEE